jgi:hypothetical protein
MKKAALAAAFFLSYSLLSEYQVAYINVPTLLQYFGVEVVCFVGSLLWILGSALDKK